jgi:hypothetical protein
MDKTTEERLLDEIDEMADAYGQMSSTEPEMFALGFVAATRRLSWDDLRQLRKGIDRRVAAHNTELSLQSMLESATLAPEFRKN